MVHHSPENVNKHALKDLRSIGSKPWVLLKTTVAPVSLLLLDKQSKALAELSWLTSMVFPIKLFVL